MEYLENIEKLFSKDFIETPLLETYEAGKINLPSGKIVSCDPLLTKDMVPFSLNFGTGEFPILVHKEKASNCIAYIEIIFGIEKVTHWKMATTENQNTDDLKGEEIFGYPVESGMGCLMDLETQEDLNLLENKLFHRKGTEFLGIYEEFFHVHFFEENGAINQYSFLKPEEEKLGNIFAFETGYGEGFYASYIGFDQRNFPQKLITEFIEIQL